MCVYCVYHVPHIGINAFLEMRIYKISDNYIMTLYFVNLYNTHL